MSKTVECHIPHHIAKASICRQARQEEIAALQARVIELGKENALLKRAVTIQQSRLQEGDAASKQQASQAEAVIAELQVTSLLCVFE